MHHFEEGQRDDFFEIYERYIPESYRGAEEARQMEFVLQVYFAVFPSLPYSERKLGTVKTCGAVAYDLGKGLVELRLYLENRGVDTACKEELLPLYAIPFVQDPRQHSIFKKLFEPRWTIDLRANLERFIAQASDEVLPPRILTVLKQYNDLVAISSVKSGESMKLNERAREQSGASLLIETFSTVDSHASAPDDAWKTFTTTRENELNLFSENEPASYSIAAPIHIIRRTTPLLKGEISMHDLCPSLEFSGTGAEYNATNSICTRGAGLDTMENRVVSKPPIVLPEDIHETFPNRKCLVEHATNNAEDAYSADILPEGIMNTSSMECSPFTSRNDDHEATTSTTEERSLSLIEDSRHQNFSNDSVEHLGDFQPKAYGSNTSDKMITPYELAVQFCELDYAQIVLDIRASIERLLSDPGDNLAKDLVIRILQALRWRITRVSRSQNRKIAVQLLVKGDIFAIHNAQIESSPESTPGSLIDALLVGCGKRVQRECLSLINALASIGLGRQYLLLPGSRVVAALSSVINPAEHTVCSRHHLLGALQKLSLHGTAATLMASLGLMSWILCLLQQNFSTGVQIDFPGALYENDAELGVGLLMNMSLTSMGKQVVEESLKMMEYLDISETSETSVLHVLKQVLQSPNSQVRAYANWALYSLLHSDFIRSKARTLGFHGMLADLAKHSDVTFVRQINFVIALLYSSHQAPTDNNDSQEIGCSEVFTGYSISDAETFVDLTHESVHSFLRDEVTLFELGLDTKVKNSLGHRAYDGKVGEVLLREDYASLEDEILNPSKYSEIKETDVIAFGYETLNYASEPELITFSSFVGPNFSSVK